MMNELQIFPFENELKNIDESKLPGIIATKVSDVAEINLMYEEALTKKKEAQNKVDRAMADAKDLVDKAAKLGQLNPKTHKVFKLEWSSKKDRLNALDTCIKELGSYGADTAEFQQTIIKIQNSTLESQNAVMEVQSKQMKYIESTTDALKFLYGLSVYGIASTESIVTNLQLILSGTKKKELGKMAKQQMYLVMDQLKSQENLKIRLDKDENRINYIEEALNSHSDMEEELKKRLVAGEEKDRQQDDVLEKQIQKDTEHDRKLLAQEEKDKEHDRLFDEKAQKDIAQDEIINKLADNMNELKRNIENIKDSQIDRKFNYITMALAVIGVIMGILHFFI